MDRYYLTFGSKIFVHSDWHGALQQESQNGVPAAAAAPREALHPAVTDAEKEVMVRGG